MGKPQDKSSSSPVPKEIEAAPEEEELKFEDIPMWVNPKDKLPVFLAVDDPKVMEVIESKKFKVYYLMALENFSYQGKTSTGVDVTKTRLQTRTFKVVNNLLGRSIHPADENLKLQKIKQGFTRNLPMIPMALIDKIDSFFRHVDDKLHTESIVILTYDPSIGGTEGWGFVVPKQENTAGNCDYDPTSIVDKVPPTAFIAGSAHSHPNMSAYASHTDTGDQLNFDGIHITFGWKGNGPTEYHIEAQMHGFAWIYEPEGIFAQNPKETLPDDVLEGFMEFVEKKSYQTTGSGYGYQGKGGTSQTSGGKTGTSTSANGGFKMPQGTQVYLSEDAPDPYNNLLIGKLDLKKDNKCPFCWTVITNVDKENRRCYSCMFMLADLDEDVEGLINARKEKSLTVAEFEKYSSVFFMYQGKYAEVDVPVNF